MKNIKFFVSTAICAIVAALATTATAQDTKQGVVTVVRIQGEARYSAGDNIWHPLTLGKTLGTGDVIETGAGSTADLVLSDKAVQIGSQASGGTLIGGTVNIAGLPITPIAAQSAPEQNIIHLQADTVLAVDKYIYSQTGADTVSDTELDLRAGKIFGNVKKISAASQYIVKTPTGVAGIRGTAFLLGANGEVTVLSGSVVVSGVGTNGQVYTTVVGAGDQFNPQTGQVSRVNGAELIAALENASAIVIAIHETVTVVETPNTTPVLFVSPTSGHSRTIVVGL